VNEQQRLIEGHLNRYKVDLAARAYICALEAQSQVDDSYPGSAGNLRAVPDATEAEMAAWSVRQRAADQRVRDTLAALCQAVADGR
jgi:hypothetical protein